MRTYELRVDTLCTAADLRVYKETIYPRHIFSMPAFGVEVHGFWIKKDDDQARLFVIVSYAEGEDPEEVAERYLHSDELASDTRDFDTNSITHVETTILLPAPRSPLS